MLSNAIQFLVKSPIFLAFQLKLTSPTPLTSLLALDLPLQVQLQLSSLRSLVLVSSSSSSALALQFYHSSFRLPTVAFQFQLFTFNLLAFNLPLQLSSPRSLDMVSSYSSSAVALQFQISNSSFLALTLTSTSTHIQNFRQSLKCTQRILYLQFHNYLAPAP